MEAPKIQPAQNIQEVIDSLDTILDFCIKTNSAFGIFPALYQVVTVHIRDAIKEGNIFQKNDRMEHLDVIFANRYFAAWTQHFSAIAPTKCWQIAFRTAEKGLNKYIILQELLTGMNAHINLDLGIAAAEVAPGDKINDLHHDFNTINDILGSLVKVVAGDIDTLSPRIGAIDRFFGKEDDAIMRFSINKARDMAWSFALKCAPLSGDELKQEIDKHDEKMQRFGDMLIHSGCIGDIFVDWVRAKETKNIPKVIRELADKKLDLSKIKSRALERRGGKKPILNPGNS